MRGASGSTVRSTATGLDGVADADDYMACHPPTSRHADRHVGRHDCAALDAAAGTVYIVGAGPGDRT